MADFTVRWSINLSAEDAEDAARQAWGVICDATVSAPDGATFLIVDDGTEGTLFEMQADGEPRREAVVPTHG
jgi:hypothetical protein